MPDLAEIAELERLYPNGRDFIPITIRYPPSEQTLRRRNGAYAKTIPIENLDVYISAVEHTLELAKIPYSKISLNEKAPERKVRTKYLTDLLVKAELAG